MRHTANTQCHVRIRVCVGVGGGVGGGAVQDPTGKSRVL